MKLKVKDHISLYRDDQSNAILNCSDIEYENYIKARDQKKIELEEMQKLKEDIKDLSSLKDEMDEIKGLLKNVLEKIQ
tara:strand:- start:11056 stop:11289 length:234 start_codon:yes stop_codon:yes gene_type:complete